MCTSRQTDILLTKIAHEKQVSEKNLGLYASSLGKRTDGDIYFSPKNFKEAVSELRAYGYITQIFNEVDIDIVLSPKGEEQYDLYYKKKKSPGSEQPKFERLAQENTF